MDELKGHSDRLWFDGYESGVAYCAACLVDFCLEKPRSMGEVMMYVGYLRDTFEVSDRKGYVERKLREKRNLKRW